MLMRDKNWSRSFIFGFLILLLGSFTSAAESYLKDWVYGNLLTAEITKEMKDKKSDMGGFSYNEKDKSIYGIKAVPAGKEFKNYVVISELGEKPGEYKFQSGKNIISGFKGQVGPGDFDRDGNMWIADRDGNIYKLELNKFVGKATPMNYTVDKSVATWAYADHQNLKEERLYFVQGDMVRYFTITDDVLKGPFDLFKVDHNLGEIEYVFVNSNILYIYPKGGKALYKVALNSKGEVALLSILEIGDKKIYEIADLIRNAIGEEVTGGESGGSRGSGSSSSSGSGTSGFSTSIENLYDYGDAPDTSYSGFNYKTLNSSPARHKAVASTPYFGKKIDYEDKDAYDAYYFGRGLTANLEADADDANMGLLPDGTTNTVSDEDGIVEVNGVPYGGGVVTLIENSTNTITVKVSDIPSGGAYVKAWLDGLNGTINYQFDNTANGIIYDNKVTTSGLITYSFFVNQLGNRATTAGNTYMRMRIVSGRKPGIEGTENDGEIEDYRVFISEKKLDFGDLPETYKTTVADDGPRHLDIFLFGASAPQGGLQTIGTVKDYEDDAQSSSSSPPPLYDGTGDDTKMGKLPNGTTNTVSDEDGVTFFAGSGTTTAGTFLYTNDSNKIIIKTNGTGKLAVYADLNRDGNFMDGSSIDSGERLFHDDVTGTNTSTEITIPTNTITGTAGAKIGIRVRFAPNDYTGASQVDLPYGLAYGGEVEDYYLEVKQKPDVTVTKVIGAGGVVYDDTEKTVTIPYEVTVKNNNALAYTGLNLEDIFSYTPLLSGTENIVYTPISIPDVTFDKGSITGIALNGNTTLVYTFSVKIPYSEFTALSTKVDNTVTLKDGDVVLGTASATTTVTLTELVNLDKVVGTVDYNTAGKIKIPYTFTITNGTGIEYTGLSLTDVFTFDPELLGGSPSFALSGSGNPAGIYIDSEGTITNISLYGDSMVTISIVVTIDSKNIKSKEEITLNNEATLKDGTTTLATDKETVNIKVLELLDLDKAVGTVEYTTTGEIKIPYTFTITNGTGVKYTNLTLEEDSFTFNPALSGGSPSFALSESGNPAGIAIDSEGIITGITVPANATGNSAVKIGIIVTVDSSAVKNSLTQVDNTAILYDGATKVGEDTATTTITPPELLDLTKTVGTVDYLTPGKVKIPYTFTITNGTGISYTGLTIKEDSFTFNPALSGGNPSFAFADSQHEGLIISPTTGEITGISVPGNSTGVEINILVTIDVSSITGASTKVDNTAILKDGDTEVGKDTATTTINLEEKLDLTKTAGTVDVNYSTGKVKIPYTFKITNGTGISYTGLSIEEDSFELTPPLLSGGNPSFAFDGSYPDLIIDFITGKITGISVPGNSTGVEIKIVVTVDISSITGASTEVENTAILKDKDDTEVGRDTATTTINLEEKLDLTKTAGTVDVNYSTGKVTIPYTFKITNGTGITYTGLSIKEDSLIFSPTLGGIPSFALIGTYESPLSINSATGEITGITVPGNSTGVEIKILMTVDVAYITGAITKVDNTAGLYDGSTKVGEGKATTTINLTEKLDLKKTVGTIDYSTSGKVKIPYAFKITNGTGISYTGLKITDAFTFTPALSGGSVEFGFDGTYPGLAINSTTGEITGISVLGNAGQTTPVVVAAVEIKIIVTISSTNITNIITKVDNTGILYDGEKEVGRDTATTTIDLPENLDLSKEVGTIDYTESGKVKIPYTFTIINGTGAEYSDLKITDSLGFRPDDFNPKLEDGAILNFELDGTYPSSLAIDSETGEITGIKVGGNSTTVIKIILTINSSDITAVSTTVENTAILYDGTKNVGEDTATTTINLPELLDLSKKVDAVDYTTSGKVKIPYTFTITNGTGVDYTGLNITDAFTFNPILSGNPEFALSGTGNPGGLTIDPTTGEITGISVSGNSTGVEIKIEVTIDISDITSATTKVDNTAYLYNQGVKVGEGKATTEIKLTEQLDLDKAVGTIDYSTSGKVKIPYTFTITNGTGISYTGLKITDAFTFTPALSGGSPSFALSGTGNPAGIVIDPITGEITGISVPGNSTGVEIKILVTIDSSDITAVSTKVVNDAFLKDKDDNVLGKDTAETTITLPEQLDLDKAVETVDYTTPGTVKIPYTFTITNGTGATYTGLSIKENIFNISPNLDPPGAPVYALSGTGNPAGIDIDSATGEITKITVAGNSTIVIKIVVTIDRTKLTGRVTTVENTAELYNGDVKVGEDTASTTITPPEDLSITKEAGTIDYSTPGKVKIPYTFTVTNGIGITYDSLKITDNFTFEPKISPSLTFAFDGSYPSPLAIDPGTGEITGVKVLGNGSTVIKIIVSFDSSSLTEKVTNVTNTAILYDGDAEVGNYKAEVEVQKAELSFTKVADQGSNETAEPGELVKYSIVVENKGGAPAYDIVVTDSLADVKNSLGYPMLDLTKPVIVTLDGTTITGAVSVDGVVEVTIPNISGVSGTAQVDIQVYMKAPYPTGTKGGETILNAITVTGVTPPDCQIGPDDESYTDGKCGPIIIPGADEPLKLRNDVFDNDKMSELTSKTLVANLPSAGTKNSNPPIINAGNNAYYFITLTNENHVSVATPTNVSTIKTDYETLLAQNGVPAFSEFEFVGILYTDNANPNNSQFLSSSDINALKAFLAGLNYATPALTEDEFDMATIPADSSVTFVVRAKINPAGVYSEAIENFASLEGDDPESSTFSLLEKELRRTLLVPKTLPNDLTITKLTEKDTVSVGQFVPYTIEITNDNPYPIENVYIEDKIPAGFLFVEGSVRAYFSTAGQIYDGSGNGITLPSSGDRIVKIGPFTVPAKADKVRVTYLLKVGVGVTTGVYKNIAVVKNDGGTPISNVSEADVRVVPDALFDQTVIIGKVFYDKNGNGMQDEELGEYGVPGVRVATIDGINAITDAYGRYHIPEVTDEHGKNFIIKVDEATLPKGSEFTTENPLVRRLGKVMLRYNFGVKLPDPKVIETGTSLVVTVKPEMFKNKSTELKNRKESLAAIKKKVDSAKTPYSKVVLKPATEKVDRERLLALETEIRKDLDISVELD